MKKPEILVEVVSDVVCPWCYIGKRRLEKAIGELKDNYDIKVSFSPFELNADMPIEGRDQKEYFAQKFGDESRFEQLTAHVTQVAKAEGLSFDFKKQKVSPNTRDAHRIIWYAQKEGKQPAANEAFMKAYFEEGIDLSKRENLVAVAEKAGLKKESVTSMLESGEGLAEVTVAEQVNHQRGISGVPFFVINNKYGVSGAQPAETFIKVLTEIGQGATQGEVCDADSKEC
ncbi:MAG: DsbA family oxidoreductase [Bacteroidota bacterium]